MDLFDELRRNSSGPPQLLLGKCFPTKWLSEFRLLCVHFVCVRKSERTFRYLQNLFAMTERTGERPSWADEGEDRIEGKVVPLVLSKPYYRLLGDIPKSCCCFFSSLSSFTFRSSTRLLLLGNDALQMICRKDPNDKGIFPRPISEGNVLCTRETVHFNWTNEETSRLGRSGIPAICVQEILNSAHRTVWIERDESWEWEEEEAQV